MHENDLETLSKMYIELAQVVPESAKSYRDLHHERVVEVVKFHLLPATMHDNDDLVANYADAMARIKMALRVLDGDLCEDY